MTLETERPEIQVAIRHIGLERKVKDYVLDKLGKVIYSIDSLKSASVEVAFEHTRPAGKRYVVQATLAADGTLLRAEDRGVNVYATVDSVHDLLERRIRDWKGRVYFQRRREAAAYEEAEETEATRLRPEEQMGRIVRTKSHEMKPMFPEDAIEQMELLGHEFFFFLNAGTAQYNVVYKRKRGGYGIIEPAYAGLPPTEAVETIPGVTGGTRPDVASS